MFACCFSQGERNRHGKGLLYFLSTTIRTRAEQHTLSSIAVYSIMPDGDSALGSDTIGDVRQTTDSHLVPSSRLFDQAGTNCRQYTPTWRLHQDCVIRLARIADNRLPPGAFMKPIGASVSASQTQRFPPSSTDAKLHVAGSVCSA